MTEKGIMRIFALATLFGMVSFHVMLALAALHEMGKVSFFPSDVDVAVTLAVYVLGLACMAVTDHVASEREFRKELERR